MKAVVQDRYGAPDEVLRLEEIEEPVAGDGEVLIRVRAASVHPDVWHVVLGVPYLLRLMGAGLRRPAGRVPGTDLAGVVEAVGRNVTRFQPGDEVFGEIVRGHQWHNGGAYAEYATAREEALAPKPANITFEQAAAVPTSAYIALQGLRDEGRIRAGERVLVNGAGGGVGVFAVQLAKAFGAEVTAVDSAEKLELLRSIGADQVIDYAREDFTRGDARYDLILDIPGNHSLSECRRVLTPEGRYVLIGHDRFGAPGRRLAGGVPRALGLLALSPFVRQLPGPPKRPDSRERLALLTELIESGKLVPVVDRTFPLAEVPAAIRYLAEGRVRGKIVVVV
jgi:NADPH:quinone reductase-like Zn-dependent oxidoreductase